MPLSLCQAPNQLRSNRLANKGDAKMQDHGDLPRFFRNLIAPVSCLAWSSFFLFFFLAPLSFFFSSSIFPEPERRSTREICRLGIR